MAKPDPIRDRPWGWTHKAPDKTIVQAVQWPWPSRLQQLRSTVKRDQLVRKTKRIPVAKLRLVKPGTGGSSGGAGGGGGSGDAVASNLGHYREADVTGTWKWARTLPPLPGGEASVPGHGLDAL